MSGQRVLVAGIGNIFLGDDGFGVEVVRRLAARGLPDGVEIVDFGIRGMDLAYALLENRPAILVDALPRGEPPGTLSVLEPDLEHLEAAGEDAIDTHGMHPLKVLQLVKALGGPVAPLTVVGCEPESCDLDGEWQMGLSAPVEAAIDGAVELVESLLAGILGGGSPLDEKGEREQVASGDRGVEG